MAVVLTIAVGFALVEARRAVRGQDPGAGRGERRPLPACEWCGTSEAPVELDWQTRIASEDEPGEPLVIQGRVLHADGVTPASDVVLYVYHTNAKGVYPRRGDESGNGRRHGYLRAWMRTDSEGRYRFETIRPAAYPGSTEPAHIHAVVQEPGQPETWIDSFVFDDDPLLTERERGRLENRGGSGILNLIRENGFWRGQRDIILER